MNKLTSFYLDLLRVFAAFGVLLVHANLSFFSQGKFFPAEIGHKLVMIFFVLSGFLIAYTTCEKKKTLRTYLIDRLSRLYSVVFPALLWTFVLDSVGKYLNPQIYQYQITPGNDFLRFFANFIYLQQIWGYSIRPSSNGAFWSISYEFWYYVIYGWLFYTVGKKKKMIGLLLILAVIGYKILLLMPVWFMGVAAYRASHHYRLKTKQGVFGFILSFGILICVTVFNFELPFDRAFVFGEPPLYFSSKFLFDYFYGIIVAFNIFFIGSIQINDCSVKINPVLNNITKNLASITFTLYLFHIPSLLFIGAVITYDKNNYLHLVSLLISLLITIFYISKFTERRRSFYGDVMSTFFNNAK